MLLGKDCVFPVKDAKAFSEGEAVPRSEEKPAVFSEGKSKISSCGNFRVSEK